MRYLILLMLNCLRSAPTPAEWQTATTFLSRERSRLFVFQAWPRPLSHFRVNPFSSENWAECVIFIHANYRGSVWMAPRPDISSRAKLIFPHVFYPIIHFWIIHIHVQYITPDSSKVLLTQTWLSRPFYTYALCSQPWVMWILMWNWSQWLTVWPWCINIVMSYLCLEWVEGFRDVFTEQS